MTDLKKEVKVKTRVIFELTELNEILKAKNKEQETNIQIRDGRIHVLEDQVHQLLVFFWISFIGFWFPLC